MDIKRKVFAACAVLSAILGAGFAAGTAQATTFNCLFSNGCGAISGVNANGTAVAVDAKYQNPSEIAIGYPNNAGDSATNVALVAHSQRNFGTHTYGDTALFASPGTSTGTCTYVPVLNPNALPVACPTAGAAASVSNGSGAGLTAAFTFAPIPVTPSALTTATVTDVLPSNLTASSPAVQSAGSYTSTVALANAAAGTYGGQSITATRTFTSGGNVYTESETVTFILKVEAQHVFTPAPDTTFYTIVFAKNGDWSSQCLTDVSAGKLRFEPCTLGNDAGQRFYAYANGAGSATTVPNVSPSGSFAFKNGATGEYLEDPSTSNPSVPQSDWADSVSPGGRQLDVNGTSPTSPFELWTWAA